ncbi:MAG: CoA transferase [Acidobacteriota bacterium]|nr:CoA transferase [Acidobacteriota bacterium]MDE3092482.1 CoA transferase [Acidobacteriota bacterium]
MSVDTSPPSPPTSRGPLSGLHVLDLSRVLAGPYAAMILGDLGADVIKIEQPGSGDDTRKWGPPFIDTAVGRESTYFLSANRNKRSVAIDLKDPAERPFIEELLTWADVVIENFRPGVMDRLGLGDAELETINPSLVRLSISGFGDDGPDSRRVGYDHILQAEGGLMSVTGTPEGPMLKVGVPIADITAALYGTIGILAGLVERATSGRGQRVSTSLLAGQIGLHTFQGTRYLVAGEVPPPSGNQHPTVCPYGVFDAMDAPIVIAVGNDAIWSRFAPLVNVEEDDERFVTNAQRIAHRDQLHELMAPVLKSRSVAHWLATFEEAGVPAGQVKTIDQVYATDQVRQQNLVWRAEHSTLGTVELPGSPLRFGRSEVSLRLAPPTLGEHSSQVRRELLGDV